MAAAWGVQKACNEHPDLFIDHRRSTRIVSYLTVPILSTPTPGEPQSDSL